MINNKYINLEILLYKLFFSYSKPRSVKEVVYTRCKICMQIQIKILIFKLVVSLEQGAKNEPEKEVHPD